MVLAGLFLSIAKFLSSILRGLGRDFLGNKLILLGLILTSTIALSLRELFNPLQTLFASLGILNACISIYLLLRIKKIE